jgi:hypothetical protein
MFMLWQAESVRYVVLIDMLVAKNPSSVLLNTDTVERLVPSCEQAGCAIQIRGKYKRMWYQVKRMMTATPQRLEAMTMKESGLVGSISLVVASASFLF